MSNLEIGQVLSLRIRFNNSGTISQKRHPYLIINIDEEFQTVEIAQLDSLEGKEYKAAMRCNKVIYWDDPQEKVIDKDSYVQMDNTLKVELYEKLKDVLIYQRYHERYKIDENKQVYISKEELENLQ